MADPATYRPAGRDIPEAPGVYRFRDGDGQVIYVGKATSLRARLASYFADPITLHPRTAAMVFAASAVDWVTVANEVEALQLEYSWIKEYEPRYNIRYRDDKSYPYLAITLNEQFPRATVLRGKKKPGIAYFGPYAHAWAIRETLDLLLRVFPVRSCKPGVFNRAHRIGRPCLLGDIGRCAAPCVGRVTPEEHLRIAEDLCSFLDGNTERFVRRLDSRMRQAAAELDFEQAARLRDDLAALRRALEKNAVVLADSVDADVIGVAEDPLEAAVQVFHVRGGRVRGQRGFVVDRVEDLDTAGLVEHLLAQFYGSRTALVPRQILVPVLPADAHAATEWLTGLRGSRVKIRVPVRGSTRDLLATVSQNAAQALTLHKTKRAGDLTTRGIALQEIQDALDLPEAPLRIEAIDISTLQGTDTVASLVVFEDGLARKADYRHYKIEQGTDDLSSITEAVTRRFRPRPDGDSQPRSRYRPNLLVIDGGAPQARAARAALDALGSDIPVVGLAKRLEELWVADQSDPVILARRSEGLYLLQRVRDEAHRFAITFHRKRRSTRANRSQLDHIPGLGPVRRKALLRTFGSLRAVKAASPDEIAAVSGIGPALARTITDALHHAGDRA